MITWLDPYAKRHLAQARSGLSKHKKGGPHPESLLLCFGIPIWIAGLILGIGYT